jgi:Helicase conserved C-terminal domain
VPSGPSARRALSRGLVTLRARAAAPAVTYRPGLRANPNAYALIVTDQPRQSGLDPFTQDSGTLYAGAGKSGMFRDGDFASVEREEIKTAVKRHEIQLVIATDAACEGLNLQTLGTLINVDLPWNPSRLEQRLGRIKRFGQIRRNVDTLNLVYHDTQDEEVYGVLSRRMKDRYDIFGGLPDPIEDDWIESVEKLEQMMDEYIHLRQKARDVFELRYQETIDPDKDRWELCSRVLARRDVVDRLSAPW